MNLADTSHVQDEAHVLTPLPCDLTIVIGLAIIGLGVRRWLEVEMLKLKISRVLRATHTRRTTTVHRAGGVARFLGLDRTYAFRMIHARIDDRQ